MAVAELYDVDFRDHVRVPAASFADTLILSEDYPKALEHRYPAYAYVDSMSAMAKLACWEFGGGEDREALPVGRVQQKQIEDWLGSQGDIHDGHIPLVAELALKYLEGRGENPAFFHEVTLPV